MNRQRRNRHRDAEESLHVATELDDPSASPPYPSAVQQRRRDCRTLSFCKTQILLQAAVSCVIPKEWKGTYYGGLGQAVLYVDLDCKFDVHRLLQMLNHRIMGAKGHSSSGCDEEIVNMCMKRFFYTHCYDSFEVLATLKTLPYRLQREKLGPENCGHALMMDRFAAAFSMHDI